MATEEDLAIIKPAITQLGDIDFIDTSMLVEIGNALAGKLMAQSAATLRLEPVELAYLKDLDQNIKSSQVRTIRQDVLSRENIVLERYLAKRSSRMPTVAVAN